jgi:hypothetical protein
MAVVDGPLHSNQASGQVGKTTIYQTYHGRTYAKRYAVPGNTPGFSKMNQTDAQLAVQEATKALMQMWPTIPPDDQATWDALAIPQRISRINAFLRENYRLGFSGQDMTTVWPPVEIPMQLKVTGTTSPTTAATYNRADDFNGKPLWKKTPAEYRYIQYDDVNLRYTITRTPGSDPQDGWTNGLTIPEGLYTPFGTYTGTPTVARF